MFYLIKFYPQKTHKPPCMQAAFSQASGHHKKERKKDPKIISGLKRAYFPPTKFSIGDYCKKKRFSFQKKGLKRLSGEKKGLKGFVIKKKV